MAVEVTLGGDRLGSGNKMKERLHNYERSSHNLSKIWRSSQAVGTITPAAVYVCQNKDTFDIDLKGAVMTLPTNGPLLGSFKQQVDVFVAPIRLYNRQLHNNKLGIGMHMERVKYPNLTIEGTNDNRLEGTELNNAQINQSSLMAYLGLRGLGRNEDGSKNTVKRTINAMPTLAYWDIVKNYYANKQEENAYYISAEIIEAGNINGVNLSPGGALTETSDPDISEFPIWVSQTPIREDVNIAINGSNMNLNNIFTVRGNGQNYTKGRSLDYYVSHGYMEVIQQAPVILVVKTTNKWKWTNVIGVTTNKTENKTALRSFPLENIDLMRERILSQPNTTALSLNDVPTAEAEPYIGSFGNISTVENVSVAKFPMAGMAVKTYQSDRFNNWLSTEWIDGATGISQISAVDTSEGYFTMDALNMSQKVYEYLNRIALTGGSYHDWQEATYGETVRRLAETPMYMGGMSFEIEFDAVVATTEADNQSLGELGGKGSGHSQNSTIRVAIEEPSFLIILSSITPRIDYSQGNKWFIRLETANDLHKPALDGIGYQELITDEMAAFDTTFNEEGEPVYKSAGKQPAWIHYMTEVNECYGTFAEPNNTMFMTLNRQYEAGDDGGIKDLTTYIDPSKYNYAFADASIEAQNFWVQLAIKVTARRKLSAKLIPFFT